MNPQTAGGIAGANGSEKLRYAFFLFYEDAHVALSCMEEYTEKWVEKIHLV